MKNIEQSVSQFSHISKEEIARKRRLENALIETTETNMPPRLISRERLAKHFEVTSRTLANWEKRNILNPIKIGRKVFYELNEVIMLQRR